MSAEVLRRAASLMRERANAVDPRHNAFVAGTPVADAEHIASWRPAVALEVSYFLEFAAPYANQPEPHSPTVQFALSIARAYLGSDS